MSIRQVAFVATVANRCPSQLAPRFRALQDQCDQQQLKGILLYCRGSLLHVLEGEVNAVEAQFEALAAELSWRDLVVLRRADLPAPGFDDWRCGRVVSVYTIPWREPSHSSVEWSELITESTEAYDRAPENKVGIDWLGNVVDFFDLTPLQAENSARCPRIQQLLRQFRGGRWQQNGLRPWHCSCGQPGCAPAFNPPSRLLLDTEEAPPSEPPPPNAPTPQSPLPKRAGRRPQRPTFPTPPFPGLWGEGVPVPA